jgi:histidyl-tRNA synthetase
MRDFYPADMRLQNWLFDVWRGVSRAFGFSEYEGPIFEFLDLYTVKSGEAIVSELFNFQDRGGRHFAIRPEMTPTLARMVAARANSLPRPIKWFCIPRMCRAERPQRGRLREFFQWNVDVLGVDDVLADAEVITVAVEFLRQVGLSAEEAVVRISSRQIATAALTAIGIAPEKTERAFQLIDRFDRLDADQFRAQWDKAYGPDVPADKLLGYLTGTTMEQCLDLVAATGDAGGAAREQFEALWEHLGAFGVQPYCEFDLKVVRGLAYYTGPVFEVFGRKAQLRAVLGGGRYDDLTGLLGGPRVTGTGFGMGDAPTLELLRELDRLPSLDEALDVFVIDAQRELFGKAQELVATLRQQGLTTDFSYKRTGVTKQFKQAAARGARYAAVVGQEFTQRGELALKNLSTGVQTTVSVQAFRERPRELLASL